MLALVLLCSFHQNDAIGNPVTHHFGRIGEFSPTTIRYATVAADLFASFGDMSGWRVAEIGGGYGGQAKVLMDTVHLAHYAIWDVLPASALQARYLCRHFGKTDVSFHSSFSESVGVGTEVEENYQGRGV